MYKYLALTLLLTGCFSAQAGVTVGATRVIYKAENKEASINLHNDDKTPYLIQSWVEDKNRGVSSSFIITPPLFRLDAERESKLRILLTDSALPPDRESLFFLNIKAIPVRIKSQDNQLNIAVNSRMKLLYRPGTLSQEGAHDAYRQLQPRQEGNRLILHNPTPYVLSLHSVSIGKQIVQKSATVEPFSSTSVTLSKSYTGKMSWQAIGDFGNVMETIIR
ncbi:molecular chaperone [Serratia fonticola]|uniref:fimbrial biogenesis chaperone n=1 Tax=Serratia fonticola TaxID=47917 RepID=UPI001AEB729F|nr:molecular chaperone [Serratia fonticola]MBP1038842.1 molecular chaperone [Serratia fonticola]